MSSCPLLDQISFQMVKRVVDTSIAMTATISVLNLFTDIKKLLLNSWSI